MQLLASGTVAIKAAVDQVQTDLDSLATAAKDDYRPQVTAVKSALQQLKTATENLGDGNGSQSLMAVGAAILTTGTAANALLTQLKAACGS